MLKSGKTHPVPDPSSLVPRRSPLSLGILLVQLGTPDAPTAAALRPYLRQFLSDPRVIEAPRFRWWLVLNLFVLPFRPRQSPAKYRRIRAPPPRPPFLPYPRLPAAAPRSADAYATHVNPTTARLVRRLGWPRDRWTQTFQSLFGREEWLKPYTEDRLRQLARRGVRRVYVVTPGFTADCLETLDEIGHEA